MSYFVTYNLKHLSTCLSSLFLNFYFKSDNALNILSSFTDPKIMVWDKSANLKYSDMFSCRYWLALKVVHNLAITPFSLGFSKKGYFFHVVSVKHPPYWYNFDESKIPSIFSPCIETFLQKWSTKHFNLFWKSAFKVFGHWQLFHYLGYTTHMGSNNSSQGNHSLISNDNDLAISIKFCLTEITILSNWSLDIWQYLVIHPILLI